MGGGLLPIGEGLGWVYTSRIMMNGKGKVCSQMRPFLFFWSLHSQLQELVFPCEKFVFLEGLIKSSVKHKYETISEDIAQSYTSLKNQLLSDPF